MTSQFQLDEGPPTYRELFGDQLIRTNEPNDSEYHVNFIQLADDSGNSVCEYSRRCSRGGGQNAQKRYSTSDSVRVKKRLLYIIGFWLILVLIALGLFVFANRNNLL